MPTASAQENPHQGASLEVPLPGSPTRGEETAKAGASISAIAWSPQRELDPQEWAAAGRRLGAIGRGSQWWVGDWIRYGTARWGEKYVDAARITNYDIHTLRNFAYVASRFDLSLRRDNLTWSHHALLAALSEEEQERWLSRASDEKLSVADLRVELRSAGSTKGKASKGESGDDLRAVVLCPKCGHEVDISSLGDQNE